MQPETVLRAILVFLASLAAAPAAAEIGLFPSVGSDPNPRTLTIYSSLDLPLARPLIAGFQKKNPSVSVRYEELLTGDVYSRVVEETDAGKQTGDVALSSAMDLQVKLANDGYAQEADFPVSEAWPRWANWRNTAYALTFEPAVFVYHKPSFANVEPPATRGQFVDYIHQHPEATQGRIATYDIERSGVGFLFMARDQEQFPDIWSIIRVFGEAGIKLYSTSSAILERVSDGRALLGYNILGSYAADWASRHPTVGIILPKDYTVVMSRIGLVPRAAAAPDLGMKFLEYCMSAEGQSIMARELHIAAVNPDVAGDNTATAIQSAIGPQLRPVPVSPGLLVYLDQVKRNRLITRWNEALRGQ